MKPPPHGAVTRIDRGDVKAPNSGAASGLTIGVGAIPLNGDAVTLV